MHTLDAPSAPRGTHGDGRAPSDPIDRLIAQRLRRQVDRSARDLCVNIEATRQIVEKVVADMPDCADKDRLMEARKRLLIATE